MDISITCFGDFRVWVAEHRVIFPTVRARALFAYLSAHPGQRVQRGRIAGLLWPTRTDAEARRNLRTELNRLRTVLAKAGVDGHALITGGRTTLTFQHDLSTLDINTMQENLDASASHAHISLVRCASCMARYGTVADLYRGDFLADVSLLGSQEFEEWLLFRREQYRQTAINVLEALLEHCAWTGDLSGEVVYGRQLLTIAPWKEAIHRRLMSTLYRSGDRSGALQQYQDAVRSLALELDARPSPKTDALYKKIRFAQAPSQPQPDTPTSPPYKGLNAFSIEDRDDFFGREALVQKILHALQHNRFLALVGPSGSGKSSIINAGVLPEVHAIWPADQQQIIQLRPGADPFLGIATELNRLGLSGERTVGQLTDELRANTLARNDLPTGAQGLPDYEQAGLLMVIDQFEELFTVCDPETCALFLDWLLAEPHSQPRILVAMRADFMGHALQFRPLADRLQTGTMLVGPLNRDEMHRAIEQPAARRRVFFEPGLIDRILDDVGSEPGNLPLLEFALTLLWRTRSEQWIGHNAYEEIERVSGALGHYADGILARLRQGDRAAARRIFLRLVQPGIGTGDTRRQATRTEIGPDDWPLAQHLADARLLVTNRNLDGEETVDIAHESLIHQWHQLRQWLDEDRAFRTWQRRLRTRLQDWQSSGSEDAALLRGGLLAEAEGWLQERREDFSTQEVQYIQQGRALAIRQLEAEERRRRLAEEAQHRAEANAQLALARQLSAQSLRLMDRNMDLAILLHLAALERTTDLQDRRELLAEFRIDPRLRKILQAMPTAIHHLSMDQPGGTVLAANEYGHILGWNLKSGRLRFTLDTGYHSSIVTVSPNGKWAVSINDTTLIFWHLPSRSRIGQATEHHGIVQTAFFSPAAPIVYSYGADKRFLTWDARTGKLLQAAPADDTYRIPRAISPDGGLHVRTIGTDLELWQTEPAKLLSRFENAHASDIHQVAFHPSGTMFATASFDSTVRIWSAPEIEPVGPALRGHERRVLCVAFSPDGKTLASGGTDRSVNLWDVAGQRLAAPPIKGQGGWVRAARFSDDGTTLATADADGKLFIWDMTVHRSLVGHRARVREGTLHPDGRRLFTTGFDAKLIEWDTDTGRLCRQVDTAHDVAILRAGINPQGTVLATGDASGKVILWDPKTLTPCAPPGQPTKDVIIGMAFSQDGNYLATGDFLGYIVLWDVRTGHPIHPPVQAHTGWAMSLAFSPDGKVLASGSTSGAIRFWSVPELDPISEEIAIHSNWVTDLLFSADGATLVSSGADHVVFCLDLATRKKTGEPLLGHHAGVWKLAWAPGDHQNPVLISLGGDGSIIWWDMATRCPVAPPLLTQTETESVQISPDGKRVYLSSFENVTHVWQVPTDSWPARATRIANRTLTAQERQRYFRE